MVIAADLLRDVVRSGLALREKLPIDEWADRYVRVSARVGAESGPWSTEKTPYLRRPMRLFADRRVRMITLMSASQMGKTSLIDILKLWLPAERPQPTLVMYGNIESARDYNQDRFIPAIEECAPARAHLRASPQDVKILKISFDNMTMWFVGSNAPQGRRMRPCGKVFCDEVDTYEDDKWVEVHERVKTFPEPCIVHASTPGDEGGWIDALFKMGSRERFWVPCPHCSAFQLLVFAQVKWDGGGHAAAERAKATARYVCAEGGCGGEIFNYDKPGMLSRGVWIAEADSQGLKTIEPARAAELDAEKKRAPEHASFQLSGLYSPFPQATIGDLAKQWVENGGQPTRGFVCGGLGETWKREGDRVEENELRALVRAGGYVQGFAPVGALGITRMVDVQKDRLYVEDRAWGAFGRDTWLVRARVIPRQEGRNLVELDALPNSYRRFGGGEAGGGAGGAELVPVVAEMIDSGFFTDEVYRCVRRRTQMGVRFCFAGKGQDGGLMGLPHRMSTVEKFAGTSEPIPGGVRLLVYNTEVWKTAVVGRIKGRPEVGEGADMATERSATAPQPGEGEIPGFYLPKEAVEGELEDYVKQLTSEHRAVKMDRKERINPRRGVVYEWQLRPGRRDNHYFDCCVGNFALADLLGVRRMGASPAPARKEPGKREREGGGGGAGGGSGGSWARGAGLRGGRWNQT